VRCEYYATTEYRLHRWAMFSDQQCSPSWCRYCSPVWSGFCPAADRARLNAFLRRCQRLGYCSRETPALTELFDEVDESLFGSILANSNHVLQSYLPERTLTQYNLRQRTHTRELLNKTTELNHRDFFHKNAVQRLLLTPLIDHRTCTSTVYYCHNRFLCIFYLYVISCVWQLEIKRKYDDDDDDDVIC